MPKSKHNIPNILLFSTPQLPILAYFAPPPPPPPPSQHVPCSVFSGIFPGPKKIPRTTIDERLCIFMCWNATLVLCANKIYPKNQSGKKVPVWLLRCHLERTRKNTCNEAAFVKMKSSLSLSQNTFRYTIQWESLHPQFTYGPWYVDKGRDFESPNSMTRAWQINRRIVEIMRYLGMQRWSFAIHNNPCLKN